MSISFPRRKDPAAWTDLMLRRWKGANTDRRRQIFATLAAADPAAAKHFLDGLPAADLDAAHRPRCSPQAG